MQSHITRIARIVAALLAAGVVSHAQTGRAHRRQQPSKQEQRVQFGDIDLFGFLTVQGVIGKSVIVQGPNTTVDSANEQTGAKSRIKSPRITANMSKGGKVDRIDLAGPLSYEGTRQAVGRKGSQIVRFTGTKGTYFKTEGRLVVEGPVDYYAEQPNAEGTGKQWVKGVADQATYDDEKRVLRLEGSVKANVFDPENFDKPQPITAEFAEFDMSKQPTEFRLGPGTISVEPKPKPKDKS